MPIKYIQCHYFVGLVGVYSAEDLTRFDQNQWITCIAKEDQLTTNQVAPGAGLKQPSQLENSVLVASGEPADRLCSPEIQLPEKKIQGFCWQKEAEYLSPVSSVKIFSSVIVCITAKTPA